MTRMRADLADRPALLPASRQRRWLAAATLWLALCLALATGAAPVGKRLVVAGAVDNDICRLLRSNGANFVRYDSAAEALGAAAEGEGVLILADHYPAQPTPLDAGLFGLALKKKLRLYVEYPAFLPGVQSARRGERIGSVR